MSDNSSSVISDARTCAGGDASVRNCYLKSTMEMDPNPDAVKYNWQPDMPIYPRNSEVRYTGGVPIMFESGTRTRNTEFPDWLYGCPYPPSEDGTCTVRLHAILHLCLYNACTYSIRSLRVMPNCLLKMSTQLVHFFARLGQAD